MKKALLFILFLVLSLNAFISYAGSISGGVFNETFTDNLGAGDPIPYAELDFRHGAVVPTSFERREITDDHGIRWIYYYFQIPDGENSVSVSWEVGGGATSATPSKSNHQFDWSSRTGITSNPFNMEIGRYYLLTILSEAPSRLSGTRTDYFYFTLEHGGSTVPNDNQAPAISISPAPGNNLQWQADVLDGHGFSIIAEDPNGISDLDWNSFQVTIAGVDKTQHFMTVAGTLVNEGRLTTSQSVDTQTFILRPDPAKFADAHNLFNLQWNGDWPVTIKLCDRNNLCASTDYTVYIGPLLTIASATDQRCSDPSFDKNNEAIKINDYVLGNIGFEVPEAAVYVGIQPEGSTQLWTYYLSGLGIPVLSDALNPILQSLPMPPGFRLTGQEIGFPDFYLINSQDLDFMFLENGSYKVLSGVLDKSIGALAIQEHTLQVCKNPL